MNTITAKEIVRNVGMSDRAEYYSGRRANRRDLSGEMLHNIYLQIKEKLGEEPAKEFVTMVEKLPSLTASNFLKALYMLERRNWKNSSYSNHVNVRNKAEAIVFATVVSSTSNGPDETEFIKSEFLRYFGKSVSW